MTHACLRRVLLVAVTFAVTGPAFAAPGCALKPFDVWHVWLEQNKVLVEGAIKGKRVSVILDTGAQRTVILRPAARRLGLRTWLTSYSMDGVDGKVPVDVTVIDEVRIGTATRRNWHMLVLGEQDFGDDVAIILGDDFFQRADIEFDLPHRVVRMALRGGPNRRGRCDGSVERGLEGASVARRERGGGGREAFADRSRRAHAAIRVGREADRKLDVARLVRRDQFGQPGVAQDTGTHPFGMCPAASHGSGHSGRRCAAAENARSASPSRCFSARITPRLW